MLAERARQPREPGIPIRIEISWSRRHCNGICKPK
jgi:hypothetical protein